MSNWKRSRKSYKQSVALNTPERYKPTSLMMVIAMAAKFNWGAINPFTYLERRALDKQAEKHLRRQVEMEDFIRRVDLQMKEETAWYKELYQEFYYSPKREQLEND